MTMHEPIEFSANERRASHAAFVRGCATLQPLARPLKMWISLNLKTQNDKPLCQASSLTYNLKENELWSFSTPGSSPSVRPFWVLDNRKNLRKPLPPKWFRLHDDIFPKKKTFWDRSKTIYLIFIIKRWCLVFQYSEIELNETDFANQWWAERAWQVTRLQLLTYRSTKGFVSVGHLFSRPCR